MLGGSAWLLAATLTVSLGSFAFWLLATQLAPATDVGRAAALFAASMFVCYLTSLGLPIAVSRYAADWSQASATLFAWSLVLRIAASLAAVAVFIALAPESIREGFATWRPDFAWLVVFLLVAGQSVAELVDVRLMALRRWSLVFVRSLLIAVIRLPFMLWVPNSEAAFYCMWSPWAALRSPASLSSPRLRARAGYGCGRYRTGRGAPCTSPA